ncbi:hypothetical protein EOPP23_21205 [Endozoicomonas sp. OPT23]|uniref:PTS transporter subunit EIIB n=1 Tax=Endozoicomonas sp. OPT23 TaxID=2072845 RepID=UPI00129B7256|nr:PTS transporter subunit EIIB [Endozoicomonas sp. OPT23]MRI35481.1 hypothetical protein [Endozoicomonas sp. OPT23]
MGFFSKLFGKNEAEQPVVTSQTSEPLLQPTATPVVFDTAKVISLLGGKDNIASIKPCAYTRVRVELKAPVADISQYLAGTGFDSAMMINGQLIHLLAGLNAEAACTALEQS